MSPATVTKPSSIESKMLTSVSSQSPDKVWNLTQTPLPPLCWCLKHRLGTQKIFVIWMNDTSPLGFRRGHGRVSQAFPMSLVTSPYIPPFGSTTVLLPCLRSSAQTPNFEISLSTVYSHTQTIPFLRGILWQLQRGHTWLHFVVYWLLLAVVHGQSFLPPRREKDAELTSKFAT